MIEIVSRLTASSLTVRKEALITVSNLLSFAIPETLQLILDEFPGLVNTLLRCLQDINNEQALLILTETFENLIKDCRQRVSVPIT